MSPPKKILVTGVNGFVGRHLARELKSRNFTVLGTGLGKSLPPDVSKFVDTYIGECDLSDESAVEKLPLESIDAVINLAGLSQMGASFDNKDEYMRINVGVHTTIAARLLAIKNSPVRVLAISSGAVYDSHQSMPLTETSALVENGSPYSQSKIAMEKEMQAYRNDGLDVVIARPFNHIGPGQLDGFLVPDLTKQVLSGSTVTAGDLTTERDYTDVRDVVKAYVALATTVNLSHPVYNVCSGVSVSGERILREITKAAGKGNVAVTVDSSRIRPNDPRKVIGDSARLRADTGWQPAIPLSQTIQDVVASV